MPLHLILDGANLEQALTQGQTLNEQNRSFYRGESNSEIEGVGPYLFSYPHSEAFSTWYIEEGLNNAWGILIESAASFEEVYKHLRRFLTVTTEDGQQLLFRFYDPRVLRVFLPTCDHAQLRDFFGPIQYIICEDESPDFVLRFSLHNIELLTEQLPTNSVFPYAKKEENIKKTTEDVQVNERVIDDNQTLLDTPSKAAQSESQQEKTQETKSDPYPIPPIQTSNPWID
jgi:hypothetical protein